MSGSRPCEAPGRSWGVVVGVCLGLGSWGLRGRENNLEAISPPPCCTPGAWCYTFIMRAGPTSPEGNDMNDLDHILTKLGNLEDKVRAGEITAVDILARLDYIAGCVEDLQS